MMRAGHAPAATLKTSLRFYYGAEHFAGYGTSTLFTFSDSALAMMLFV